MPKQLGEDLNGDGAVDVVTANQRIGSVSVLLNKDDGTLREAVQFEAGNGPKALAAASLKARAGLDLVAAGSGSSAGRLEIFQRLGATPERGCKPNGKPDECETRFHRGDPNSSGTTDISDGITIFGFLFLGDPIGLACKESSDANNDGRIDISDGVYLLNWLFTAGPEPAPPGPAPAPCGLDPDPVGSARDLGCAVYGPCQ